MTLRVAPRQRGFHHHRSGPRTYMIQMFGYLVMIWLQICSTPSRMTCHNILTVIFNHPLVHTLLRVHICFMRTSNHCAQILRNTRTWPPQSSQRFILQSGSIFILEIHWERGGVLTFSTPDIVPYLLPSSPRNHAVFF